MTQPTRKYLDALLYGIREVLNRGAALLERSSLNFAAPLVATDDESNLRTNITIDEAGAAGAGIVPIATDVNDVLVTHPTTKASLWDKLTNAHVDPAAAIAGTKVAPDFGAQNVATTGDVDADNVTATTAIEGATVSATTAFASGASPAAAGAARFSNADELTWDSSPTGNDIRGLTVDSSGNVQIGKNNSNQGDVFISAPTGHQLLCDVAGTIKFSISEYSCAISTRLSIGAAPASFGAIRLSNNGSIQSKDAGTGTVSLMVLNASDVLAIGADDGDLNGITLDVATGKTIALGVNSVAALTVGSTVAIAQNLVMASGKDLDCKTNGAYFKPRRISQDALPTPDPGELAIWHDSDALPPNGLKLVYNDETIGVVQFDSDK